MRLDRHVFGSRAGYTTLAYSDGLSESDCRKLEVFGFGQTSDRGYLTSLASVPAYISRPLDSNRRAITRVFPGRPDDAGRNTLLLISVVSSNSEWIRTLRGDVLPLLNNPGLWKWDGQARLERVDVSIPGPHPLRLDVAEANEIIGLISEIERLYSSNRNVVISEPKYSLTTVRSVEMLIPDSAKPTFSCSARSLSANLSVNLNCVAKGVGISSVGPSSQVYKPRTDGILSLYATELVRGRIMQGVIPDHVIRSHRGFGAIAKEVSVAQPMGLTRDDFTRNNIPPTPKPKRVPMSSTKKAAIGLIAFGVIACLFIGYKMYLKRDASAQQRAARARLVNNIETTEKWDMTLEEFVGKPDSVRQQLLQEAERREKEINDGMLHLDNEDTEDAGVLGKAIENVSKLAEWQHTRKPVHDQLLQFKEEIETTAKVLGKPFPEDQLQQLSQNDKEERRKAIQNARSMGSKTVNHINISATSLKNDIALLETKAKNVEEKIRQRESAYEDFVIRMKKEYEQGFELGKDNIAENIGAIDQWANRTSEDADKEKELSEHTDRYVNLKNNLDKLNKVKTRIERNVNSLEKESSREVKKALEQYQGIMADAEPFKENLKGLLEEAALAKAQAQDNLEGFHKGTQIAQQAQKITAEIREFLDTNAQNRNELAQSIKIDIEELQKLDKGYASDLLKIFTACKTIAEKSAG